MCAMPTIVLVAVAIAALVAIALGAVLGAIAIVSFPLKAHGLRPMSQGGNYTGKTQHGEISQNLRMAGFSYLLSELHESQAAWGGP